MADLDVLVPACNRPVELATTEGPAWSRWTLHNAANGVHLAERLGLDTGPLPSPERCQLRVMARRGGAGVLPSGAYHQEAETTLPARSASAVDLLG